MTCSSETTGTLSGHNMTWYSETNGKISGHIMIALVKQLISSLAPL